MALAILEWVDSDESQVRFRIDTGTNTQYQLKVGRAVRQDDDGEWLDDVYLSLPPARSGGEQQQFAPPLEISVVLQRFERGPCFAQLYTSKDGGRAQTVSEVVQLPGLELGDAVPSMARASSLSLPRAEPVMTRAQSHRKPRNIPCRLPSLSRQTSLESLLGEIVKVASPVVMDLLKGAVKKTDTGGANDLLGQALKALLGALEAPQAQADAKPADTKPADTKPADAGPADTNVAKPQSIARVVTNGIGNRFVASRSRYARPMIFGVDDALIASLVGPVLQILPQLANAANQKRVALKKADNDLVAGILSDINKRLLMDKLLEAQQAAQQQGGAGQLTPDQLKALTDLMAKLPAGEVAKPASLGMSFSTPPPADHQLSNRAVLEFTLGKPLPWNDSQRALFDRGQTMLLKPRLVVGAPVPKSPLPKAILKIVLQDAANPDVRAEKVFKLTAVAANTALECSLEPAELSHLPKNSPLNVLAELRWRTPRGETRAYGSTELVLVDQFFVKTRGAEVSPERELTDMNQYRAFWNKVWEAPLLDDARGEAKKYSWELDVIARYAAVLTAGHESNGFMETRLLQEAQDPDSLIRMVSGRLKGGIELSTAELNKLIPLWPGNTALDPPRLEALNARPFLEGAARECKYNMKLKGRHGQGGMVWVIPTFKLFGVTLSAVASADATGQVTATRDEVNPFPLPVAARLIGLKSAA
jgi:hypothetical protein